MAKPLLQTPLHKLHLELGASMAEQALHSMPRCYPGGTSKEHLHTRQQATLTDLSPTGQVRVWGPEAATALETLMPADLIDLPIGQQRYAFLTGTTGGILADLLVTHAGDHLLLLLNANHKAQDIAYLQKAIGERCRLEILAEQALLALQGPCSAQILARLVPDTDFSSWSFRSARTLLLAGVECVVMRASRCGEDGFEISIPNSHAEQLARQLLAQPEVLPAGFAAHNSLRLEAGLCQFGQDINPQTSPVEAGLGWCIPKSRRVGGKREGGFPGEDRILAELIQGPRHRRVGLTGLEKAAVKEGSPVANLAGDIIGSITSSGVSPCRKGSIAMAYLPEDYTALDAEVLALSEGRSIRMQVSALPFIPIQYYRN